MPSPTSFDRRASPPRSSNRHSHQSTPSRSRSRSPRRRNDDRPKVSTGEFRWKDKSRDTDNHDRPNERRLERGYRDRDRNDRYRDRDGDRDHNSNHNRDSRRERNTGGYRDRHEDNRRGEYSDRDRHDDRSGRRNDDNPRHRRDTRRDSRSLTPVAERTSTTTQAPKEKSSKKTKPPRIAPTAQPMIIVNVNDRLGTKTAIPCLASDSIGNSLSTSFPLAKHAQLLRIGQGWLTMRIGDFKKLVGAHIGRKPHEIMLKRQGERPFKDILTLEDYGVSNGVQLDLEVDTGD
ncbi:MAG: hypothetical protein Q9213_003758 [Squamulea squamosa]